MDRRLRLRLLRLLRLLPLPLGRVFQNARLRRLSRARSDLLLRRCKQPRVLRLRRERRERRLRRERRERIPPSAFREVAISSPVLGSE